MTMKENTNPKIIPEQLQKWAETQYVINIEKGWHKPQYDVNHYLCLIMRLQILWLKNAVEHSQ